MSEVGLNPCEPGPYSLSLPDKYSSSIKWDLSLPGTFLLVISFDPRNTLVFTLDTLQYRQLRDGKRWEQGAGGWCTQGPGGKRVDTQTLDLAWAFRKEALHSQHNPQFLTTQPLIADGMTAFLLVHHPGIWLQVCAPSSRETISRSPPTKCLRYNLSAFYVFSPATHILTIN